MIDDISPGAVILMHSTKANTVAALPKILDFGKSHGYRFVTMSEWKQIMIRTDPIATRMAVESKSANAGEAAKATVTEPAKVVFAEPAKIAEAPRTDGFKAVRY